MDYLNDLFDVLSIKHQDVKHKLIIIVKYYLNGDDINFDTFDETSKNFIKEYGEEIVIKEIKKHSDYVNINDVNDIICYCLD